MAGEAHRLRHDRPHVARATIRERLVILNRTALPDGEALREAFEHRSLPGTRCVHGIAHAQRRASDLRARALTESSRDARRGGPADFYRTDGPIFGQRSLQTIPEFALQRGGQFAGSLAPPVLRREDGFRRESRPRNEQAEKNRGPDCLIDYGAHDDPLHSGSPRRGIVY